jgi:RNA polymerase-binding protein DksA
MAERAKAKSTSAASRAGSGATSRTGKKTPAKKSTKSAAETGGEGQSMAEATNTTSTRTGTGRGARTAGSKTGATKGAAKTTRKSTASKSSGGGSAATKTASKTATKATGKAAKTAKEPAAKPRKDRSAAEVEKIRSALDARRIELREEYDMHLAEIAELQRDRLTDSAGDDQADTGSKTFEREQEISLANSILERIKQVERALERLDEGSYGWCERCGDAIPVERLAAFPSATLCVRCKQLEERR